MDNEFKEQREKRMAEEKEKIRKKTEEIKAEETVKLKEKVWYATTDSDAIEVLQSFEVPVKSIYDRGVYRGPAREGKKRLKEVVFLCTEPEALEMLSNVKGTTETENLKAELERLHKVIEKLSGKENISGQEDTGETGTEGK